MVGDLPPAEAARIQSLTRPQFALLWQTLRGSNPRAGEQALKARCRTDRLLFARYFFHEKLSSPFSRFHRETFDEPKVAFADRPPMGGWRRARMVPRGNGKTTTRVRVEAVHDVVYGLEPFIVILAEQHDLSISRLREIRLELERNTRLRHYFGDLVGAEVWRAETIETANGIKVSAKSMRGQVRGITDPLTNARPTKVYLDDAEHSRDVLNPELRVKTAAIFHEDIEGGGTTDGRTCYQFTGTPLHREALLPSLRANPAWEFRAYSAIEAWPERLDLWERCRALWAAAGTTEEEDADTGEIVRATPPSATDVAWRFYQAHRAEMDRGARVLWPEHETLFGLMVWRWANGETAFSKEKQLVPRDPTLSTFDVDRIVRHTLHRDHLVVHERSGEHRKVPFSTLRFVAFHDPAKADPKASRKKRGLGDFAAIVVLGVEELKGGGRMGHVVTAWMQRRPPSEQITAAFELAEKWRFDLVVENDTLGLLGSEYRRVRLERKRAALFWQVAIKRLERQTTNKDARIASLEPAYSNGWLTWSDTLPQVYIDQHRDHPTGDHDDGPDATEGAWRAGVRKGAGLALVNLD